MTSSARPHINTPLSVKTNDNQKHLSITLAQQFEKKAQEAYPSLQSSPFFDRTLLKNVPLLSTQLKKEKGINLTVKTSDQAIVHGTLFDRSSNTLLVVGPGFPSPKEKMAPFIHLFSNYDIVLFDYRGQGIKHVGESSWHPSSLLGSLTYKAFGLDLSVTKLGTIEARDVKALVHAMKKSKNYKHVYGIGLCYSSFIFAQAIADEPDLFDKIIFDSVWPSLQNVAAKIAQDTNLVCGKQPPSSPWPWLTHKECFKNFAFSLTDVLIGVDVTQWPPLVDFIAKLNVPILYFQCSDDWYCSLEEFETLWAATPSAYKTAVMTQNMHGRNYLWQKEMYADICNHFLNDDHTAFTQWLQSNDETISTI